MRRSPWRASTSWPRCEPRLAVGRDDVARGFATLKWPARVEILGHRPLLVIDGAHNGASAVALADTLRTCFPPTRRTLVFGTTRDKDLRGQLQALLPMFDEVIATRYRREPAVPVARDDRVGRADAHRPDGPHGRRPRRGPGPGPSD